MQLPRYDISVVISDPDDPKTLLKVTLSRIRRENIKTINLPSLADMLETFEEKYERN